MSVFLDIVDNNFDYLIETLPAKFLQCKVAIFPFVINKSCGGNLYTFCPPILTSFNDSHLKQFLLWNLPNGDFQVHHFFYIY